MDANELFKTAFGLQPSWEVASLDFDLGKRRLDIRVQDCGVSWHWKVETLAKDASMDGIYVIRTSVPKEVLEAEKAVLAYKRLAKVERAFRTLKSVDLQVRPIYHRTEERLKAHLIICMLAYYVREPISYSAIELDRKLLAEVFTEVLKQGAGLPVEQLAEAAAEAHFFIQKKSETSRIADAARMWIS